MIVRRPISDIFELDRTELPTPIHQPIILIALSARILAESSVRAGWQPISIDLFADSDVRVLGRAIKVDATDLGFSKSGLLTALQRLCADGSRPKLVYGGGVDGDWEVVKSIGEYAQIIGNSPETLRIINTPQIFFSLLRLLDIPHPETRMDRPGDTARWLLKYPDREGGKGIYSASDRLRDSRTGYYQRQLQGPSLSALFLANGCQCQILGFNTQTVQCIGDQQFLLSGISSAADLVTSQQQQVADSLEKLVKSASLRGMGSIDFILADGNCMVLEVNPRPSASLALYDEDYPNGLLNAHIEAVAGQLLDKVIPPRSIRAMETVYADRDFTIPHCPRWPPWIKDRPLPNSVIKVGSPLCTVLASGSTRTIVEKQMSNRKDDLYNWLERIIDT